MKRKPLCESKRDAKSYSIDQSALYNTSSRAKLASVLLLPLSSIVKSIGQYSRFPVTPKFDPFSGRPPRKSRNVQKPKGDLLRLHNRILRLLKYVAVPDYMQAALAGTSYRKNAAMHLSGLYVATLDIKSFFEATNRSKVFNFFESTLACPGDIADIYSRVVVCEDSLPTGSPLSPIMSYYANKELFDRLNSLAQKYGLIFSCYVDDLTFSGDHVDGIFLWEVEKLIRCYGHRVAEGKTKLFKPGVPRHVTGVVVLDGELSVPGSRYKKLRKIDAALSGKGDRFDFSEGELLNIKAGVLGEIAYIDPEKIFLAKRAIQVLKNRDREMLGDGTINPPAVSPRSLAPGEVPPWEKAIDIS